jgi:hypothetical protein
MKGGDDLGVGDACRWMDVTARLVCPNLAPDDGERDALVREFDVCLEPHREVLSR